MTKARLGTLKGFNLRPTQEVAIDFIRNSETRFIAVRGPTGIGKTCLGFESVKTPFYYVCSSIQLQEQAVRDYPEAALLKGRGNYYCPKYETADLCMQGKPCPECEYNQAKEMAMMADMTILNFHYFLNITNFTKNFPVRNLIIDEADDLENVLINFISFDFSMTQLKAHGLTPMPPSKKTVIAIMPEWIDTVLTEANLLLHDMLGDIKGILEGLKHFHRPPNQIEIKKLKKYKKLQSLAWKLRFLNKQDMSTNWIYRFDDKKRTVTLKPKWLKRDMVDAFLFSKCERILFMSATLPSKEVFCGLYEIEPEELDYIDLPNVWESDKRKIYCLPSFNLSFKNKGSETDQKVLDAVLDIISKHAGRGVIHTVSYALAELVKPLSDRIIAHGYTDKAPLFEKFKQTKGAIWASPSSARGIDLPDDLCEFIIWLKAPFLNLRDPQVSERINGSGKFGKLWYASDAAQTIIQGCGRGFRHPDDACTVYLLDENIERLMLQKRPNLFPKWFQGLVSFASPEEIDEGWD